MKRDMNLIRDLLLFYESDGSLPYPAADDDTISEHEILMIEGGLLAGGISDPCSDSGRVPYPLDGRSVSSDGKEYARFPITWDGHDFLAAARDDNRWQMAMKTVGSLTFEVIKEYLQNGLRAAIGLLH